MSQQSEDGTLGGVQLRDKVLCSHSVQWRAVSGDTAHGDRVQVLQCATGLVADNLEHWIRNSNCYGHPDMTTCRTLNHGGCWRVQGAPFQSPGTGLGSKVHSTL